MVGMRDARQVAERAAGLGGRNRQKCESRGGGGDSRAPQK